MERNITEEQKEQIINFGAFDYRSEKISHILMWELKEVEKLIRDKKSEFYKLYMKGLHTRDYVLDEKLFDMSRSGDLKALEEFTHRLTQRK